MLYKNIYVISYLENEEREYRDVRDLLIIDTYLRFRETRHSYI